LLAVVVYLTWHCINRFGPSPGLGPALAVGLCGLVLLRLGLPRTAAVIAVSLVLITLYQNPGMAFGPTYDDRFNGRKRMGLVSNPLLEFLASRIRLAPGRAFAGYADDAYARLAVNNLNEQIISNWLSNWQQYGNGQKLFAWNMFGIPTITQYSPYIKPLYFGFIAALLDQPTDRQAVNYLTITAPSSKVLSLVGVRYLVSDVARLPVGGLRFVMQWGRFYLFELPRPNLASYSPTRPIVVHTALEGFAQIAGAPFAPESDVLVTADTVPIDLVRADGPARLVFERGGYAVRAHSRGRSLIVLPVQFSHCFAIHVRRGDRAAKLVRVNVVQTGLLFTGEVDLEARFEHWPLASPRCQKRDYEDSLRLEIGEFAQRPGEEGRL
jgi:hypothetical protein